MKPSKEWDGAMSIETNQNLKFKVHIHYCG